MAYTKTTDFAAKDALLTGNPLKLIKGTEIGAEFDAIEAEFTNVQNAANITLTSVSGTNIITATAPSPFAAYATGQTFRFTAAGANTGAVTLNLNSVGAKAITKNGTTALAAGDIASDAVVEVTYDGTQFQLISMSGGLSASGNLSFTGTGNRITGDFSNATVANRVMFQSSTVNGYSVVDVKPNGTSTLSGFEMLGTGHADPLNASSGFFGISGTNVAIQANKTGTGSYGYIELYTGGAERMRIDTNGQVRIGSAADASNSRLALIGGNAQLSPGTTANEGVRIQRETGYVSFAGINSDNNAYNGIKFYTSATASLQLDTVGNVVSINPNGGLGYGTGAGGSVTQATSRTTGVTLNKPTGSITLFSAAGSTSWRTFTVTNTLVAATDTIVVSQKSGTDLNEIHVTAIAAGSFNISFKTTGGTTTEQPVFNFSVIKGATS